MTKEVRCDICNIYLKENEVALENKFAGLSKELKSKNVLLFKYDGVAKRKDLCYSCAKKINDSVEKIIEAKIHGGTS